MRASFYLGQAVWRVDVLRHIRLTWPILLLTATGCHHATIDAKSLLSEPRMSSSSVVLDLFFVRLPYGDERINGAMWERVDEQLAPMLRQKLAQQGFRAGVCNTHPPEQLELLLNEFASATAPEENIDTEFAVEPMVIRRHVQLPAGNSTEIIASSLYESLPLLQASADGHVSGQTLHMAQGVFAVETFPEADGRVHLRLRPEVQYGDPHRQFSQRDKQLVLDTRRSSKVLEDLVMDVHLASGEMLVITCLPNRSGSAGHRFFTEAAREGLMQKLLVVRLSQTQHDAALGLEFPLPDEGAP